MEQHDVPSSAYLPSCAGAINDKDKSGSHPTAFKKIKLKAKLDEELDFIGANVSTSKNTGLSSHFCN
jgi:hypothetical protein